MTWGFFDRLILGIHRAWNHSTEKMSDPARTFFAGRIWILTSWGLMTVAPLYGWLIFRVESIPQLLTFTQAFLRPGISPEVIHAATRIASYVALLCPIEFALAWKNREDLVSARPFLNAAISVAFLYVIVILGSYNAQNFIYFAF